MIMTRSFLFTVNALSLSLDQFDVLVITDIRTPGNLSMYLCGQNDVGQYTGD